MQDTCAIPTRPPSGGVVTMGTLILAAASALALVLLSGCHASPAASGFVSTRADKSTEARLRETGAMAPLQPFDEQFVAATPESNQ
jgi:hypothetical protein